MEKQYHELQWISGIKHYMNLNDLFRDINISGTVYAKRNEKQSFMSNLFTDFDVGAINLESLDCPNVSLPKQQYWNNLCKPSAFNHSFMNCA